MKVLLTGVTGFVGEAIERHLLSRGYEVFGVHARQRTPEPGNDRRNTVLDIGSISAVEKLRAVMSPCDFIIHAAVSMNMDLFANEVTHTNCAGVQNLLWLAEQWQTERFVFLSSVPVIGTPRQKPVTESHTTEPLTSYHASKLFGEHLVSLAAKRNISGVSLRLSAPVGPRMPRSRLLPMLVTRALSQRPLELAGTGSRKQNYVDVRDIAKACELSFSSDVSGVVNIASSDCIANLDLARRCIAMCGSTSEIVFTGREDFEEGIVWDISIDKAKKSLGYVPEFNVDDMISQLIAALADGKQ